MVFRNRKRAKAIQLLLGWTAVLLADFGGSSAFALDLDSEKIRGNASAKPVTVLQNRYFLKSHRPEAGIVVGSMLNEAYTNTKAAGLRLGYFISDWVGFEFQYLTTSVEDTNDRTALNSLKYRPINPSNTDDTVIVSPDPEVNPIRNILDVNTVLAPFYGKLNFLDRHIIYSDLYLSGGISKVTTDQGSHTSISYGAGQRFYFSNSWSARIDFRDRIYTEVRADKKTIKHAYSFDVGASYFFF